MLSQRPRPACRRGPTGPVAGWAQHGAQAACRPSPRMDLERRELTVAVRPVHVTPTEYDMLPYLLTHAPTCTSTSDKRRRHIVSEPSVGYRLANPNDRANPDDRKVG